MKQEVNMYDNDEQSSSQESTESDLHGESILLHSETSKQKELAALRSEMTSKRVTTSYSSREESVGSTDPFIPMFTVISLAGLFGAYGYEMIRLYNRGELYLPWH